MDLLFDVDSNRAIHMAKLETLSIGERILTTRYLLLGLLKTSDCTANQVLIRFSVTPERVSRNFESVSRELKVPTISESPNESIDESNIQMSDQVKTVFQSANVFSELSESPQIETHHILLGILETEDCEAYKIIGSLGLGRSAIIDKINYLRGRVTNPIEGSESKSSLKMSILDELATDLTGLARRNRLDPVFGREKEIRRAISILLRRSKNNPVFVGEPGVGKTALVEGIAQKIAAGAVPVPLRNRRILSLEMGRLLAGTKFRGEFEERLKKIVDEINEQRNIILFIDEIHTLIGAGNAEGAIDAANILKPALSRGTIQCIGATTFHEYTSIENDGALERRFQPITVEEITETETVQLLVSLKHKYEQHHGLVISESAIREATRLSARYIRNRQLPDKSIDLLDESAARLRLMSYQDNSPNGNLILQPEHVAEVLSDWNGIPVTKLTQDESWKLLTMEANLNARIFGQGHAVKKVVNAIVRSRTGVKNANRPVGSFIFLGPSGVGKTYLAKLLAEELFDDAKAIVRIDMSEYRELQSLSRLIGAAPGLVGFEQGGQLTEQVRKNPYCIVLFDEMEKAHPDVLNLLLQVLEDGRLTDSKGKTVDFTNSILIFTSNVGYDAAKNSVGFAVNNGSNDQIPDISAKLDTVFKPELINRFDEIITFNSLGTDDMRRALELLLDDVAMRLKDMGTSVAFGNHLKEVLLEEGLDLRDGVRPIRRLIEDKIENFLSYEILKGNLPSGIQVVVTLRDGETIIDGSTLSIDHLDVLADSQLPCCIGAVISPSQMRGGLRG